MGLHAGSKRWRSAMDVPARATLLQGGSILERHSLPSGRLCCESGHINFALLSICNGYGKKWEEYVTLG